MYSLITFDSWREEYFEYFVQLKNALHKEIENYIPESIEDYSKYFAPDSPFHGSFKWKGFIVFKDTKVVAKAILCWRERTIHGNLGFIDWCDDYEAALFLVDQVRTFAKEVKLTELKSPVDINFFINFRVRLPSEQPALYGEPTYPAYYSAFFERLGFESIGEWDLFKVKLKTSVGHFRKLLGNLSNSKKGNFDNLKVRSLNLKNWDSELEVLHGLFIKAYSVMPDFEPISLDQFKVLFDKFKYIANPAYCFIAELNGFPVAFNINYHDPQDVLKSIQGKDLNIIQKVWTMLRLRYTYGNFLIAHVGRIPGPNGEEIKGVQAKFSRRLIPKTIWMKDAFLIQRTDALSKRTWDDGNLESCAKYVLYGMKLE